MYGLYLYDTWKDTNPRIIVHAGGLTRYGFNLSIRTFADTKLWGARISWMACPKRIL